jgi:TolB-like protein
MASLIPGYEYDIFISYRQKDNKGDRWVSEFVDALKTELESTFKEEISVYFDINPHDGLLETHDVDASLKEKLKCLVFIPIISRTYCDPKSFAWEHEFKAFVEQTSRDKFGLKVKLPNGNIANRVLPIQLHDLDIEDKVLIENALGGVLRSIEFIYKEAGVNKPLTSEDDEKKNLCNTKYRIQINKTANAIKEIISGLKTEATSVVKEKSLFQESKSEVKFEDKRKDLISTAILNQKSKKWMIILLFVFLCIAGVYAIYKIIDRSKQTQDLTKLEKSIAVLPFLNDSPSDSTTYFINGLMEEMLNNLQKIKVFRVLSRTSVEQYRGETKLSLPEIAKKLNVNYIVEGSGQKYGNKIVLRVQLITADNEKHLWGKTYEQELHETSDIINIQSQIAQAIATELKAIMTPEEKQLIEKTPTANLSAYDAYLQGQFYYEKNDTAEDGKAIFWFKESIKFDSTFALPWTYLSMCYWRTTFNANTAEFKEAKRLAERALELDPTSGTTIVNMAEILDNEYDFEGAEEKIKLALKIDPNNPYVLRNAGRFYTKLGRADESISFCNRALQIDLNNPTAAAYLALAYFYSGRFEETWTTLKNYENLEFKRNIYYEILLEENKVDEIVKEPGFEENDNARNVALAAINFKLNHKNIAEKLCSDLIEKNIPGCAYWIAFAHSYGDEPEKVYTWLEKSFAAKEIQLTYLGVDPAFKKFRNEPRVKKLLQKMKFPI